MTADSRLRIVVTGLIAQHPRLGGVAWDYLQYPVGLHRLGHDVYYIEDSGEWPYRWSPGPGPDPWVARDCAENVEHLHRCLEAFGMGGRWAYRNAISGRWYGMSDASRTSVLASADLLINVSGTVEEPDRLSGPHRSIYIDSDPAFTQVRYLRARAGLDPSAFADRVDAHERFFSFGETLPGLVPDTGHAWLPTRQPILLDQWLAPEPPSRGFTTVLSWASYRPLEFAGRSYAQKDVQFRRYLQLPGHVQADLEVATNGLVHADWQTADGADGEDGNALGVMGWRVTDALSSCGDLGGYRDYIRSSLGEWSVAKHGYVSARTGWFSCRSACYLAAGRPVVVEDTGFSGVLPTGEGLLSFSSFDEAVDHLNAVTGDYVRHATGAAAVARECFAADKVLTRLIDDAATTPTSATAAAAAGALVP